MNSRSFYSACSSVWMLAWAMPSADLPSRGPALADQHNDGGTQATEFRDANIVDVSSYEEMAAAIKEGKWARGGWAGSDADEKRVKEETQATLRCFPFEQPAGPYTCFLTGGTAERVALFAKAY